MAFRSDEVAEISVNGTVYRDWETVLVHIGEMEPFAYYRFTCSEGAPLAKDWAAIRIRPGDYCTVSLAGEVAIEGLVTVRQVAYTATEHGIEIIGYSETGKLPNATAITKTGEFKDKGFSQIAQELTAPTGVNYSSVGKTDETPFKRFNLAPGASVWETLEQLARQRGIPLWTGADGQLKGGRLGGGGDALIEGYNILEGRETLSIQPGTGTDVAKGQRSGNDDEFGTKVAHEVMGKTGNNLLGMIGSKGAYSPRVTLAEIPGLASDMSSRSGFEAGHRADEQWNVQIVVQGWVKPSGGLWGPVTTNYYVKSPMLIMDNTLRLRAVTYTQDNRTGTRTTLELVRDDNVGRADVSG